MRLIKTLTEAPRQTHPHSQLRIYVNCKTNSEESKNKSEFHFFKRRLVWISVFRTGYRSTIFLDAIPEDGASGH